MRSLIRHTTAAVLAAVLALTLTSCSDDDNEPKSEATPTGSTSTTPTTDPSAWTSKYSEKEVAAFDAALERFTTYEKLIEPAWRAGKATEKARALMEEYWYYPQWETEYEQLRTYERSGIKRNRLPKVLWSKPKLLKPDAVVIRQCIDSSEVQVIQDGKPAKGGVGHPFIRTIHMSRPAGDDPGFLISQIVAAGDNREVKPCTP